jgi:hypothetical protein
MADNGERVNYERKKIFDERKFRKSQHFRPQFWIGKILSKIFISATIMVGSKKQSCRSCPCSTNPHFDFPLEGKTERFQKPVFENEPDPEQYSKLNKIPSKKARTLMSPMSFTTRLITKKSSF